MTKELKIKNCFLMMIYGDALGFSYENNEIRELRLQPFVFKYNDTIALNKEMGQWSDLTELLLIQTKSLMDLKEKARVTVDEARLFDELKYWRNYRNGRVPTTLLYSMENLGRGEDYWKDKRGYGYSRIVSLLLANKNYNYAIAEIYNQIVRFNRHPQVIISGLLLARTLYLLLEQEYELQELIAELKGYLMDLRLRQLEDNFNEAVTQAYILQFEREKVDFLLDLDRLKQGSSKWQDKKSVDSREILLLSLLYLYQLLRDGKITYIPEAIQDTKEAIALAYCLWGARLDQLPSDISQIKHWDFIDKMGEYLLRIRYYEIGRRKYSEREFVDIFQLQNNRIVKHPVFNTMKVVNRREEKGYIFVEISTKAGDYTFLQKKKEDSRQLS